MTPGIVGSAAATPETPGGVATTGRERACPIVGVGASAGGLEAFRRLLGALPGDTGMAYVLVQHLDPHHESILAELLSGATSMEVSEVEGDVRVVSNRIYVIPRSKGLILADGVLKLVPRSPVGSAHMPIDFFLQTLADVQGSQAIGVILSGMGTDGTLGLKGIKAAGGIAFAQEPASAKHGDMPRSAMRAGCVDFVMSPEDIGRELTRLGAHPYLEGGYGVGVEAPADTKDEDGNGLSRVLALLRRAGGTDFSAYKKTTLRRRIARRMAVRHIDTFHQYAVELEGDPAEASALYQDCLISVTSFFRDPDVFDALGDQVLSRLLTERPPEAPVRIWVPGCATGEEVYSIAMSLVERMAELLRNPLVQIFATDLSEGALAKAREGMYLRPDVSPERLRRFFAKVGEHYQISKAIRELCVFARHDLTRDPPYSRIDLISCRNVLIYLEPSLQERVFGTFHYALRPEGFLLVGAAETASASSSLFSVVDDKHRIYSRKLASGPPRIFSAMSARDPSFAGAELGARKAPTASEVPREVDRMLLARCGPAAVVVDEELRVLEFRGDTDPFLDHSHGKASLHLDRLLRNGLLVELRQAIAEARFADAPIQKKGLQVRYHEQLRNVSAEVLPIRGRAAAERCLLVLFESDADVVGAAPDVPSAQLCETNDGKDRELSRLALSLAQTTDYMHTLVREHEGALEDLQSTTEEALSGNEELQSLNEELQTAKEEIQSANEELTTLNQELQDRNAQLARSHDDIQRALENANALVDTVPQPLVILDGDLRIQKANIAFYATFRATAEHTRGRLISELGAGQWNHPELLGALRKVLASGAMLEDMEMDAEFPNIGLVTMSVNAQRLHPGRDAREGILLAIQDTTASKRAARGREALLSLEHTARQQAEAADQLKDQFVATVSHELRGPLTVISGWMDILLAEGERPDPAILARALAAIGRGVTAQGRLISDLLDHSRIVTGKLELQRAPVDLVVIAEAALVGVQAAAQAKDIDVRLSGEPATSVVLGDADRMQQVFWNLFLNAIKFTPRRGTVRISIGRVQNQVHVTVTDSGCGISSEFLPYVFERFRQAEGSSFRTQPGLGLGLTLVRELVELHGGTVQAESAGQDRGSTFTVILPIPALLTSTLDAEPPFPSVGPESELPPSPSSTPPSSSRYPARDVLEGMKVLVVDDEQDAREAVVHLLERYGARVRFAGSVVEAMAALALEMPDVLISDLGMPGQDGYELIRRVRLLPAHAGGALPSLAVSAYGTEEHRKRAMATGFQKHLEKPVAPAELVFEVARLGNPTGSLTRD